MRVVRGEESSNEAVHQVQGCGLLHEGVSGQALAGAQVLVRAQPAGEHPGPRRHAPGVIAAQERWRAVRTLDIFRAVRVLEDNRVVCAT